MRGFVGAGSVWQGSPESWRRKYMHRTLAALVLPVLILAGSLAWADEYADTVEVFKKAGESSKFFDNSYGYAVFPSIGKGGLSGWARHTAREEFTSRES